MNRPCSRSEASGTRSGIRANAACVCRKNPHSIGTYTPTREPMSKEKRNWNALGHDEKLNLLRSRSLETLADEYYSPDIAPSEFAQFLAEERDLWNPDNLGQAETTGNAPRKDIIIGSWRDLDRAEAILELIDNSIDAWMRRREKYPTKTPKTLSIYIDVDESKRQLTYEDNAGGVSRDNIENLVIPGYSETGDLEATIRS